MEREIIKIDENLCNGCGECIPECHEGALQIIDDKARLISDLMCDGLGACLGHCPMDAMEIERREAEPYNETTVIKLMLEKGYNTVVAHLRHLKDHEEYDFIKEAMAYLSSHETELDFTMSALKNAIHAEDALQESGCGGGCPSSQSQVIKRPTFSEPTDITPKSNNSELQQWPVQMHLINPGASFFQGANMVLAADCVPFAMSNFHDSLLKNKVLGIACPKLDNGKEIYLNKLITLIKDSKINSLTVVIMQVPCCGGLIAIAQQAVQLASRKVPLKKVVISIQGELLSEDWV